MVDDSVVSEIGKEAITELVSGGGKPPAGGGVTLSKKTIVISALLLLGIGAAVGRFEAPDKIVTKVVTQTVTQVVTKEVVKRDTEVKKNTVTTITETTKPDGTKVKTTTIANKDDISTDLNKNVDTNSNTKTETVATQTVTNEKRQWIVSALVSPSHPNDNILGSGGLSYGASVQKEIIGPFYGGAFGLTNQTYGVSLGVTF